MPHLPVDASWLQALLFMLKLYGIAFLITAPLFLVSTAFMCLVIPSIRKEFIKAYHEFKAEREAKRNE